MKVQTHTLQAREKECPTWSVKFRSEDKTRCVIEAHKLLRAEPYLEVRIVTPLQPGMLIETSSDLTARLFTELAEKVMSKWRNDCLCGQGLSEVSDCPGPPAKEEVDRVKAWIKEGMIKPLDIFPFSEPESWQDYLTW